MKALAVLHNRKRQPPPFSSPWAGIDWVAETKSGMSAPGADGLEVKHMAGCPGNGEEREPGLAECREFA